MIPDVIGLSADEAEEKLRGQGFCVCRVEYVSRRGVPDADSERVIRTRRLNDKKIELTVSHFKTKMGQQ